MKNVINNQRGYTLLEMLIVLFIVMTVSSIVMQFSMKFSEKQMIEHFIKQVQFDIQHVQALSLNESSSITFSFNDKNYTASYVNGGYQILKKSYPPGVQFYQYSSLRKFNILSGELWDFGKVRFGTPIGERQIILNMQKGRMKVVKL